MRGSAKSDISTPALLLDRAVLEENIARMADRMAGKPAALRPHCKVHKSPEIAKLQVEAGAIGVTAATVWEAAGMVEAGIGDVLIANQVVGATKVATLAALARKARLTVAVDDRRHLDELGRAAEAADAEIGIVIECDTGMGRSGVRTPAQACRIAASSETIGGLAFRGVMGWEGHSQREPDARKRAVIVDDAVDILVGTATVLGDAGFVCEIVSAGGTATYEQTGSRHDVTEIQAGSYVVMDVFHEEFTKDFSPAVTVLATVVSKHGRRVILDCGRKAVGVNRGQPRLKATGESAVAVNEEHASFDLERDEIGIGDCVEVVPGYTGDTVNDFDSYLVTEGDVVVDVWPVVARYGLETYG